MHAHPFLRYDHYRCDNALKCNQVILIKIYDSTTAALFVHRLHPTRSISVRDCTHTYFRFVSTPILVHCSRSSTGDRVNSRQWMANQVSMCRTIYCHKSWNKTKLKLIGKKLETVWLKTWRKNFFFIQCNGKKPNTETVPCDRNKTQEEK